MIVKITEGVAKLNRLNLAEVFNEKFKKIFPNVWMMFATLVALALVITILFFLMYKPIKKVIKARQEYIQNNIDQAKETYDLSKSKLEEANNRLINAHNEAENIVKNAKLRAEKVVIQYTSDAKKESKRILEEARLSINKQKQNLLEENKNQVAKAASEISRKILQKEVSKKTQDQIINDFLKEEGN